MTYEKIIKRYSAYYLGWCQAFGDHEFSFDEETDINWLFGEAQIGLAVAPSLRKQVLKEILGQNRTPLMVLSGSHVEINKFEYNTTLEKDKIGLKNIAGLFKSSEDIHMYLTSHFCYPSGTRILTFSKKKPLIIMYKEIEPLKVQII